MAFLTKWGSLWGTVPPSQGRIYFIAPSASYTVDGRTYSASDNNDGLSPERALRTLSQFVTNASANVGDVAILLAGTHTVSSVININKAGLTVLGVHAQHGLANRLAPKAVLNAAGQSNEIFNVTADDFELGYVELRGEDALATITFGVGADVGGPGGFYLHDCLLTMGEGGNSTGSTGVDFGYRSSTSGAGGMGETKLASARNGAQATAYLENNVFQAKQGTGPAIVLATVHAWINGARFLSMASWNTQIQVATDASGCLLENAVWMGFGTGTVPIDGTDANTNRSLILRNCDFDPANTDASKPLDNFTTTSDIAGAGYYGEALIGSNVNTMTATGSAAVTLIT